MAEDHTETIDCGEGVVYTRGDYYVTAVFNDPDFRTGIYYVTNRVTGVVEFKDVMLPAAISWTKRLADYDPIMDGVQGAQPALTPVM